MYREQKDRSREDTFFDSDGIAVVRGVQSILKILTDFYSGLIPTTDTCAYKFNSRFEIIENIFLIAHDSLEERIQFGRSFARHGAKYMEL